MSGENEDQSDRIIGNRNEDKKTSNDKDAEANEGKASKKRKA